MGENRESSDFPSRNAEQSSEIGDQRSGKCVCAIAEHDTRFALCTLYFVLCTMPFAFSSCLVYNPGVGGDILNNLALIETILRDRPDAGQRRSRERSAERKAQSAEYPPRC